jgi:hypothetical protein
LSINTVNYPTPVTVNGYSCKNCTDVDNAKRNIDPSHPKDGPFGVNKIDKPGSTPAHGPAVTLGGALAHVAATSAPGQAPSATQGLKLDVRA